MRAIIASLFIVGCFTGATTAAQSNATPAPGKAPIRACSLLTRDLVAKHGALNPKLLGTFKPEEEPIGAHGSSCSDVGVMLQVNPFLRHDDLRKSPGKDWHPVSGIGDAAFFKDNGGRWGELIVWTGRHHFTLQMSVPNGATAESVKPKATALATALVTKLRAL